MEFGTQEFPFPEQPAERQLVTHPAHRVGGIPRQAKTLRKQRRKLDSRIVHRQYGIQVAADLPQNDVRRLLWPVEMKRHDGSQAPGWGQLVAVVGRSHDLHAKLFRGRKKIVVAVAGGGQKQQDALHGSDESERLELVVGGLGAAVPRFRQTGDRRS